MLNVLDVVSKANFLQARAKLLVAASFTVPIVTCGAFVALQGPLLAQSEH